KSKGNLVLVSALRRQGVEPMAIRLLLLAQHYRREWEYTDALLDDARARLDRWREALSVDGGADAAGTVAAVRSAVADDLDTAGALAAVDAWVDKTLAGAAEDPGGPGVLSRTVDAVLGVRI
ncbi:MAG TPA: cysteine--1-D-myo-inosityl 2-amino-2-deoxy-alpha-D-glucopyranoside ligase, partial [Phycicoccus sp.]